MKNFIKSLERSGNESLIEAILEGYTVIFENNDADSINSGHKVMPETGTTVGDESLPLYRFVSGDNLRSGNDYGMHWTHSLKEIEQMASEEAGFIITAKHPGKSNVMDWENIKDRPMMEREIGGYEYRNNVFPEVPIRPNTKMDVISIVKVDADGNRTLIKGKEIEDAAEYIKDNKSVFEETLTEATGKSELQILKDNKVPLTDDERKEVFKKDAVWHSGSSIDPNTGKKVQKVSAVWKSKNPKTGDITYISNTHRLYNTAKSLDSIINKYHNVVKDSA